MRFGEQLPALLIEHRHELRYGRDTGLGFVQPFANVAVEVNSLSVLFGDDRTQL